MGAVYIAGASAVKGKVTMFCSRCGNEIASGDRFCPKCGLPLVQTAPVPNGIPSDVPDRKHLAGLLGVLLGGFGIHKFYLGFTEEGILEIVMTLISCGGLGIIGFIEGLIYLTKSDEAFYQDYIVNRKKWF